MSENKEHEILDLGKRNDAGLNEVQKDNSKNFQKLIFVGAVVITVVVVASQFASIFSKSEEIEAKKTENQVSIIKKDNFFAGVEEEKADDTAKFTFGGEPETPPPPPSSLIGEGITYSVDPIKPPINKSNPGFMVKTGSNQSSNYDQPLHQNNSTPNQLIGGSDADVFTAPAFKPSAAFKSEYNPHLLLSQGTVIHCSLRGRLVSNVGGQVSCIVTDNVLSSSGAVVLIERGSIINGFYQGNTVERGHNEIFVVWQEVRTPNNLVIPVYSGSTDPLGANGLSGWVDNHFWERFGNAMVLSIFNDVTGALSQNLTKNNKRDYIENTREDSRNLTAEIIKRTSDIEPTLYKNQGDKINVFIARDIDFSNVYKLRRGDLK